MRKSRFSENQITAVLKEHQAGIPVVEWCRNHGINGEPQARAFVKRDPVVGPKDPSLPEA